MRGVRRWWPNSSSSHRRSSDRGLRLRPDLLERPRLDERLAPSAEDVQLRRPGRLFRAPHGRALEPRPPPPVPVHGRFHRRDAADRRDARPAAGQGGAGEGFFRSIYLFPMAISFIASGIVWRWLMNPAPGDRASGLNVVFDKLGVGFLGNQWWQHPDWGAAALALPAVWALGGYIMALYLAGFRACRRTARGGTNGRRVRVPRVPARRLPAPAPGHARCARSSSGTSRSRSST